MKFHNLFKNQVGASAIEFAILAPVFLTFIFGIIESSRAYWQTDVIRQASYDGARCAAIGDLRCLTAEDTRNVVVAKIQRSNFTVSPNSVTVDINTTCDGLGPMARVSIDIPFSSAAAGLLPITPDNLTGETCMPIIPT